MAAARNYVLVADAEPDLERHVRAELAGAGLEVFATRDGLTAHDALAQRGAPLVLVADLNLPRRDGFALLRGLRRVDRARAVPAVVVAHFPQMLEAAVKASAELGPLTAHRKPLPPGVVARAVREALRPVEEKRPVTSMPAAPRPAFSAPPPQAEERRLAKIAEMNAHDRASPPDPELQSIVQKVAVDFDVPMALATLVLEDRQWFKAYSGVTGNLLAERGTLREWSFCQHVVEGAAPLIVPDAREHPLFADNPLVKQGIVTGYAGAPLTTPTGEVLGSLCLIDRRPLDIDPPGIARLVKAARALAGELEVRSLGGRAAAKVWLDDEATEKALPYLEATLGALEQGVVLLGPSRRAMMVNPGVKTIFGVEPGRLRGKTRDEIVAELASSFANARDDLERLQISTTGPWVLREDIELANARRVRWVGRPVALPDGMGQLITMTDVTPAA